VNPGAILACFGSCIAAVPWWAWLIVALAGAIIGALTYLGGVLLGPPGGVALNLLIKAILLGSLAAVAATFGYCLFGCVGR
jgi:hypothetical protein